jgi:hypothetical protein
MKRSLDTDQYPISKLKLTVDLLYKNNKNDAISIQKLFETHEKVDSILGDQKDVTMAVVKKKKQTVKSEIDKKTKDVKSEHKQDTTTKKKKSSSNKNDNKIPTINDKRVSLAIHPCGCVFMNNEHKKHHITGWRTKCSFLNELYEFPICICGFKAYSNPENWAKQLIENKTVIIDTMEKHCSTCSTYTTNFSKFQKDIQQFGNDPHKVVATYSLSITESDNFSPEEYTIAKKIKDRSKVYGCIGCWQEFESDKLLYVHLYSCPGFSSQLPILTQEIYRALFMTQVLTWPEKKNPDIESYLQSDIMKRYVINQDGKKFIHPFPQPQDEEEAAELEKHTNGHEEKKIKPDPIIKEEQEDKNTADSELESQINELLESDNNSMSMIFSRSNNELRKPINNDDLVKQKITTTNIGKHQQVKGDNKNVLKDDDIKD